MGVNNNFFLSNSLPNTNIKSFLDTQTYWGHRKEVLNPLLNFYMLGFNNNFAVFNSEHSIEHLKRCIFFCSKVILGGGNILFVSSGGIYEKMSFFFACRSMQFSYCDKWIYGLLVKNVLSGVSVLATPKLDKSVFLVKEAFSLSTPIISVEDSDFRLHRIGYSFPGNNDSKKSIHFFYNNLTNSIIKVILLSYYNNRILLR